MLSLFKSKPTLKELIPEGYTDIHSHLLFGLDDGAQNINESESLMKACKEIGFDTIITTPHTYTSVWNNTQKIIQNKLKEVQSLLPELSHDVQLRASSEYMMDDSFIKLFQSEKLLTLKENYVLVEMSYISPNINLFDILFELQITGYKPVLAHPERYTFYHNNFDFYQKLKNSGCYFQANLLSSVDYYGKNVTKTLDKLLKNNMIDFTGSDIHNEKHIQAFSCKIKIKEETLLGDAMRRNSFFS